MKLTKQEYIDRDIKVYGGGLLPLIMRSTYGETFKHQPSFIVATDKIFFIYLHTMLEDYGNFIDDCGRRFTVNAHVI